MILRGRGDAVEGERLVSSGRKITKPILIPTIAKHRGVQVIVYGIPARCYVSKPLRILQK